MFRLVSQRKREESQLEISFLGKTLNYDIIIDLQEAAKIVQIIKILTQFKNGQGICIDISQREKKIYQLAKNV